MVTCEQEGEDKRRTEVEDEPRGEKIGLLLTEHKASGLGPLGEEGLLSFSQPCGGRRGASRGYRVSSVCSGNMSSVLWKSQDVSFRGTIDPTGRDGGKPGRANRNGAPLKKGAICQEGLLNNSL